MGYGLCVNLFLNFGIIFRHSLSNVEIDGGKRRIWLIKVIPTWKRSDDIFDEAFITSSFLPKVSCLAYDFNMESGEVQVGFSWHKKLREIDSASELQDKQNVRFDISDSTKWMTYTSSASYLPLWIPPPSCFPIRNRRPLCWRRSTNRLCTTWSPGYKSSLRYKDN